MEEKKLNQQPAEQAAELTDEILDAVAGGKHPDEEPKSTGCDDNNHHVKIPMPR